MNKLVEKILGSGLIDRATAELMERWGNLEPGAAEKVNEDALKGATRLHLIEITESLAVEVEKEQKIKETYLDLERLRWPVKIHTAKRDTPAVMLSPWVDGVIDRQGRYYFRIQDVKQEWFVPGYLLYPDTKKMQVILEVQPLYIEEEAVVLQVTTEDA